MFGNAILSSQVLEDNHPGDTVQRFKNDRYPSCAAEEAGSTNCSTDVGLLVGSETVQHGDLNARDKIDAESSTKCMSCNLTSKSCVVCWTNTSCEAASSQTDPLPSILLEHHVTESHQVPISGRKAQGKDKELILEDISKKAKHSNTNVRDRRCSEGQHSYVGSTCHDVASANADSCPGSSEVLRSTVWDSCPPHGVTSIIGRRREMEDEVAIVPSFLTLPWELVGNCPANMSKGLEECSAFHFFGVYDGHGGVKAARFCKDYLHLALAEEAQATINLDSLRSSSAMGSWQVQWEKVMNDCFLRMDVGVGGAYPGRANQLEAADGLEYYEEPTAPETVGSTAVVAVIGACHIIVANCGDSRAVLSRGGRAVALSVDHKPDREDEMARIEGAGGKVICWNGCRVFGVLAMSRAIGDHYLKPYVIATPEVTCTQRSDDDECLILASDGLWDVLSNDEVCDVARRRLAFQRGGRSVAGTSSLNSRREENAEATAALLTKMALAQGSNDNISVVVVDLKDSSSP
eukprot:c28559_g1_i3 orf=1153-2712(-)